jgi:hypothetical protein
LDPNQSSYPYLVVNVKLVGGRIYNAGDRKTLPSSDDLGVGYCQVLTTSALDTAKF